MTRRLWICYPQTCFPGGTSGKEHTCQCRRHRRCKFDPWVEKIPWSRKWQSAPVFLPGKLYGQRSSMGYSPQSRKELNMTVQLSLWACMRTHTHTNAEVCVWLLSSASRKLDKNKVEVISWNPYHIMVINYFLQVVKPYLLYNSHT